MFATKSFLIAIANRLTEISEECTDIETKEKLDVNRINDSTS